MLAKLPNYSPEESQKMEVFADEQNARIRFSCPVERFIAYELRIYSVGTGTPPPGRFLIGILKSNIATIREDLAAEGAREYEIVNDAFKRAWDVELRKAFIGLLG